MCLLIDSTDNKSRVTKQKGLMGWAYKNLQKVTPHCTSQMDSVKGISDEERARRNDQGGFYICLAT